jgi:6-phosphogluconolactonase (cycloisomerase 2 family)
LRDFPVVQIFYGASEMLLIIKRLVLGALPSVLLLLAACAPHSTNYSIGGTVTGLVGTGLTNSLVLQDNGGDNLTVTANGGFTFATKITGCNGSTSASGVSSTSCGVYSVTILTQPLGLTCTVTNGSGTATGDVGNVLVNCTSTNASASQHFAYVANAGDGTVSQYTIASNGTLAAMTIPTVAAGTTPYSVTVDALGKYAYVANSGSNTISQYTVGTDGALTAMSPATVAAGTTPYAVTVDPSSQYVYVANSGSNTISQYTIGAGGALTPMSTATVSAGTTPYAITVDPSGKYVYVANEGSNTISQYTIGTGGALTPMSTAAVASGANPYSITIANISGQEYAYVANSNSTNIVNNTSSVSQYTVGSNGGLIPMNPVTVATGTNPVSVAVDNSGQYAYVANYGSNNVSQYKIGSGGALTAMSTATVAAGTSPYSISIDPLNQFIYVANYGGYNVSQYTIGAGGLLTSIASATTVVAGTHPISVITAQ